MPSNLEISALRNAGIIAILSLREFSHYDSFAEGGTLSNVVPMLGYFSIGICELFNARSAKSATERVTRTISGAMLMTLAAGRAGAALIGLENQPTASP